MDEKKIARINQLAAKAKTPEGLTQEEREEQLRLRREYIDAHRQSLIRQLENTYIQYPDGTRKKLQRRPGPAGGKLHAGIQSAGKIVGNN